MFLTTKSGHVLANPVKLDDILTEAVESYPGIQAGHSNINASKLEVTAAKLAYGPNISFSTQYNRVGYAANSQGVSGGNIPSAVIGLNQRIWGGGIEAGLRRAKSLLKAADYGLLEAVNELKFKVVSDYFLWKSAHERHVFLLETVDLLQQTVDDIRRRNEQGVASLADLRLAQSRVEQARSDLALSSASEAAAGARISALVGKPMSSGDLEFIDPSLQLPDLNCTEIENKSADVSPRLNRIRAEADSAEFGAQQASAAAFPEVAVQLQRVIGSPTTPGWPSFTTFGLTLQYAPGAGLTSFASARGAKVRARSARQSVSVEELEFRSGINAECLSFIGARAQQSELQSTVNLSRQVLRAYQDQYAAGKKSIFDLVNILRDREQSEFAVIEANNSVNQESWRIYIYTDASIYGLIPEN
jgi:adhesin transport system outer membrane protein